MVSEIDRWVVRNAIAVIEEHESQGTALTLEVNLCDGEFVRNCPHNQTDRLLVQAVVDIARGLGKQAVAESVPDDDALRRLTWLGVDYGEGYHLGRPLSVRELAPSALAGGLRRMTRRSAPVRVVPSVPARYRDLRHEPRIQATADHRGRRFASASRYLAS